MLTVTYMEEPAALLNGELVSELTVSSIVLNGVQTNFLYLHCHRESKTQVTELSAADASEAKCGLDIQST